MYKFRTFHLVLIVGLAVLLAACPSPPPPAEEFTLEVTVEGQGTVTSEPEGIDITEPGSQTATFAEGTDVTLEAEAAAGWTFVGWTGDCDGTGDCVLTMDESKSATATFEELPPDEFDLEVTVVGEGSVESTPEGIDITEPGSQTATFAEGTDVTLEAEAAAGWTFVGWTGDCDGTGDCVLTMDESKTATATFEVITHDLTVEVEGEGSVESNPEGIDITEPGSQTATFDTGTDVTLTAEPDTGLVTVWGGDCAEAEGDTCVLTMDEDKEVSVTFTATTTVTAQIVQNPGDDLGMSTNDAQEFEEAVNPPAYEADATWIENHENNLAYDNHWDSDIITGLRFIDLDIPQGAMIVSATVQFTASEPRDAGGTQEPGSNSEPTSLVIEGEASDDTSPFVDQEVGNISNRPVTASSVAWDDVPAWTADDAGPDQETPDLSSIVQEIVDRSGWDTGHSMVLIFSGEGQRVAYAYRESPANVPVLTVEYVE